MHWTTCARASRTDPSTATLTTVALKLKRTIDRE
jgi:hypothetical protein